jgi:hypothetical protein
VARAKSSEAPPFPARAYARRAIARGTFVALGALAASRGGRRGADHHLETPHIMPRRIRAFAQLAPVLIILQGCASGCSDGGGQSASGGDTGSAPHSSGGGSKSSGSSGDHSATDGGATIDPRGSTSDDGGSPAVDDAASPVPDTTPADGLTPLQKHKAEMLTSIWENSTTVLQYPYCENINDGRGYTSGRAGFCSGTGDAIEVVDCFDKAFGGGSANPMVKYMPALTALNNAADSADTSGLDAVGKYCADWTKASIDPATASAFKKCQDKISDELYYQPALAQAHKWGLVTALTKAELYDAEINHGDDGVSALVKQANQDVGNTAQKAAAAPLSRDAESAWLHAFLMRRLALLKSDSTWADAVDRVTTYEQLRLQNNFDLGAAIETNAKATTMYPGKGYKDSGYPDCTISPAGAVGGDASCTSATGQ